MSPQNSDNVVLELCHEPHTVDKLSTGNDIIIYQHEIAEGGNGGRDVTSLGPPIIQVPVRKNYSTHQALCQLRTVLEQMVNYSSELQCVSEGAG